MKKLKIEEVGDYDWNQLWGFKEPPDGESGYYRAENDQVIEAAIPGDNVNLSNFEAKDIKKIHCSICGENDGPTWIGIVELKDGRFAAAIGGCDYTGWD